MPKTRARKANARKDLHHSIMIGDLSKVKTLCEAGVDFISQSDYCNELIQEAVYYGHLEIIKYLMSIGASLQSDKDYALITASEKGYLEIVKYLVSQGANIHCTFKDELNFSLSMDIVIYLSGNSPIQRASVHEHLDVVVYLSNLGADISNISPTHKRYIAFCQKMEEKRRHRAAKKIYYWWIEICYDITRACGQRMKLKNLAKTQQLGFEFSD